MRSRIKVVVATTIVTILVSISPAEALFGSECKKPKSTYAQYLTSSRALQAKEAKAQSDSNKETNLEYFRCTQNPKAFLREKKLDDKELFPRNKDGCSMWKIFFGGGVPYVQKTKSAVEEYRNAMLIVTSYKKCFDPSVYIEAVKWLKVNSK